MPITPWDEIKAQVGYDELPTEGKVDTINKYSQYVQEYYTQVEPRDPREVGDASDEFVKIASQEALGDLGVLERGSAFLGNIYKGAAGTFTSAFRAAALAQQAIGESLGNYDDSTPLTERDLYKIAQNVDESVKQTTGIEDPRLRNDFINTLLPQGLGSALGFFGVAAAAAAAAPEAAAAGVGLGTAAALGAAANAGQIYEEAKQMGANEFVSRASAAAGGVVGLSEAIPLGNLAGRLTAGLAKRSILHGIIEGASEEFLQETGQQMANNLIASKFAGYDPNRGTMEGALQSGAVGLVTGGLIGGGVNAITRDNEAFYADRVSDEIRRKADLAASLTPERLSQIAEAARNARTTTKQRINIETGETESESTPKTVFGDRVGGEVPDIGENPAVNSVLLGRSVSQDAEGNNTETFTFHTPQGLLWEAEFKTGEPVKVRDVTDDSPLLNPITNPSNPKTVTRSEFTGRIISPTSSLAKEFGLETEQEMDQRLIAEAQRAMQLGKTPDQRLLPDNQIIVDSISRDDRGVARQVVLRNEIDRLYKIREAVLARQILVGENANAGTTEYDPNTAKQVIKYDSEGNKIESKQEVSQRVARLNRMIGMRENELRGLIARPEGYILASERNTPPSASQKLALVQGFQNLWNSISSPAIRDAITFEVGDITPMVESGQVPKGAVAYYKRASDGRKAMIFLSDKLATVPIARREMLHELGHAFWDTLPAGVQAEIRGLWKSETQSRTGALFDEFGGLKAEVSPRVMDSVQEFFSERLAWTNDNWAKGLSEQSGIMDKVGRAFRTLLDRFLRYTGHGERLNLEFRSFLDQGDRFSSLRSRISQATRAGIATEPEDQMASIRGMVKYEKLFEFVKNNPDGFTVDPVTFRIPKRGYVVAPSKATEDFIPSNLSREDAIKAFRSYMLSQENIFKAFGEGQRMVGVAGEGAYFGGWRTDTDANNNKLPEGQYRYVTDISFVLDNKADALYLAENGKQQSIFDIAAGQVIDTEPALSELRASGILPPSGRGRLQELGGKVNQLAGREGSLRTAIQSLGRTFNPINQVGRVQAQAGVIQEAGSAEVAASVRGAQSPNLSSGERNDLAFWVSQRTPTAVKATENPIEQDLVIGLNEILRDKSLAKKQSKLVRDYVGFKTKFKNDEQVLRDFVDHLKGNLLWLHDSYSPELRDRARLWYQGGRKIVDSWAIGNSLSSPQVAGTLAVLSPQKDWFMNLSLAERVLKIHTTKQGEVFSPEMVRWFESDPKRGKLMSFVSDIAGKRYSELTSTYHKALFIRAYDEVNNSRSYSIYSPEGDKMGLKKKLDGEDAKVAWGSFPQIQKAVSIIENPTRKNISLNLGKEHKVRNFYNNLLLPNLTDYGDVTIDTHAVAAGLLRPLAGGDTEVLDNLGSGASSGILGVSGLYGLYADAYRLAAAERGVLPREMQSITWEAVRGLFEDNYKREQENKALIDGIWRDYERGKTDEATTRQRILEAAGGIENPEWSRGRAGAANAGEGNPANPQELSGSGMARQDGGGRDGRRVREPVATDVPQEVRASTRGSQTASTGSSTPVLINDISQRYRLSPELQKEVVERIRLQGINRQVIDDDKDWQRTAIYEAVRDISEDGILISQLPENKKASFLKEKQKHIDNIVNIEQRYADDIQGEMLDKEARRYEGVLSELGLNLARQPQIGEAGKLLNQIEGYFDKAEAIQQESGGYLASTRGEQARQLLEPVISFGRANLRTGGALPYDIFRIAEQRGFNANEKMLRSKNAIDDLDAASKRVYGRGLDKLTADESSKINEALQNPIARARLAPDLAAAVGNARNLLDSLSAELIRSGAIPDRLVPVVTANMGVYLTRAYEKWENPKFENPFSKLPKEVQNRIESTVKGWMESRYAHAYAKEQSLARGERSIDTDSAQYQSDYQTGISRARNGGITKTEIRGYIDMLGAPEGESPFSQIGSGLTKDLSIITARKDIPPEIRQLWGEIKDPRVNFMLSMQRMTNLLETHNMLKAVRDAGMNKIFFSTPREGFSTKLVSQGSKTTSPLNMFIEGMSNDVYTSEEIAKAMQDTFGGRSKAQDALGKMAEWYLKANGISKFAKTVLSVQTQVRNLFGNAQFLIANGYIFSPDGAIAMRRLREIVLPAAGQQLGFSNDKALRDYSAKLTRLGILGQGVFANEMQSYFKDANINMATDFFDNYLMKSLKKVGGVATGLYQMGDSIPKAIAFEVELARLRRAYPAQPISKLETMAADKVLNLLPTYSRIPKLGNILRSQPFVGAFISFPLEVVRTGYNLIGTINEELRSDNPEIRKTGAYRLTGTMLATVGFSAAAAGLAAAMGVDDEDDKAIRQLDAPWDKYATKLYLGRDSKGNVQQVNLSYVDPYNYLRDPLIALVKADGTWDQKLLEAVKTTFEPFYGEQILAGKILDISRNKKGTTGGRVYNPEGGVFDKSTAIAGHMFDAFNIGTIASGIRVYRGLTGQVTPTGRAYDPALETLATVTGQRVVTLDPRQSISFAARKFNNRINDATGIFTAAYYDRSNLSQEAKQQAYIEMMQSRSEIFRDTSSIISAAIRLGVSRGEILQILKQQGVSRQSAVALLNGVVSPYTSSKRELRADATRYRQQALSATR